MSSDFDVAALLIALVGLMGGLLAAFIARRHNREQQARVALLEPADQYARTSLSVLALLRYVTPPSAPVPTPHRNEPLLADRQLRERRLAECAAELDEVRRARARVRLAFHPRSPAAEKSRAVLDGLRKCLEAAEEFYSEHDRAVASGQSQWNSETRAAGHDKYKTLRKGAYEELDDFFEDVAERLIAPTWNPRRIKNLVPLAT